ncbi:MAG TPA: hypothetical protein VF841_20360 [Anaeromyxobacter sp.]
MGRSRLGVVAALALTLAGRAGAAEITNIATRGEPGHPFDLRISFRWDRFQERAQITREVPTAPTAGSPTGGVAEGDELRYERKVNAFVPRVAIGVTHDLEVHFEWPYVAGDDRTWRYGQGAGGQPSGPAGNTIETNAVDANNAACAADVDGAGPLVCPLFIVGSPDTTVYHGGRAGDLKSGIAWGIFDDKEDPTKPFWLVGVDVTFPTAARYDPAGDRDPKSLLWVSPHTKAGDPGAVGEKVWKWDFQTVLSRRLGPIDPYVKAHLLFMTKSSGTYSNCDHAAELAGRPNPEMNSQAPANCAAQGSKADARLPWMAGITFGTELVPYENEADQQRVALDFRLFGDYTSAARFYNELTDMSGKLNWTDEYLTMGGYFGISLRASKFITLQGSTSISTSTAHWLTGEPLGNGGSWPALGAGGITADPSQMNPNFDWRYDAPGRRFRISEVANFAMSFAFVLTF